MIGISANALAAAIAERDPERAASLAQTFLTSALSVGADLGLSQALGLLGRTGMNAEHGSGRNAFRALLDRTYDAGDTRLLLVQLDNYSQILLQIGRAEPSALLFGTVGRDAQHLANPISIARREAQRTGLADVLGNDRFTELAVEGANLEIAGAVGLARQELDRVINVAPTGNA